MMFASAALQFFDIESLTTLSICNVVAISGCILTLYLTLSLLSTVFASKDYLWAASICFKGSKSFFFASLFYPLLVRNRIFVFYAFARLGDDLIDDYKGEQLQRNLLFLQRILDFWYSTDPRSKASCYKSIDSALSLIPTLPDSFSRASVEAMIVSLDSIIEQCSIPRWAFELLLHGFRMDTESVDIRDESDLLTYCISVASSIGLICCFLYQDGTMDIDQALLSNAASLGIAFQLTNISRDIITDLVETNRIYVPRSWLNDEQRGAFEAMLRGHCDVEQHRNGLIRDNAVRLIQFAEVYYATAWDGIEGLPQGVRFAIYSALAIYREIGVRILGTKVYPNRSFTTLADKISLVLRRGRPRFEGGAAANRRNRSWEMLQRTVEKIGGSKELALIK